MAIILVVIGSLAGESLLFLSFRHFFHSRIVKFRKEHEENYGTIVQVITQHKRWMIFLIRLSAIPVYPPSLSFTDDRDISLLHYFPRLMKSNIENGYTWSWQHHGRYQSLLYSNLRLVRHSGISRAFTCRPSNILGWISCRHILHNHNNWSSNIPLPLIPRIQIPSRSIIPRIRSTGR